MKIDKVVEAKNLLDLKRSLMYLRDRSNIHLGHKSWSLGFVPEVCTEDNEILDKNIRAAIDGSILVINTKLIDMGVELNSA